MINEQELNEKILKFAGFTYHTCEGMWWYGKYKGTNIWWESPEKQKFEDPPNFLHDFNACIKWIIPMLDPDRILLSRRDGEWRVSIMFDEDIHKGAGALWLDSPSLAFCLAVERIIDGGNNG
jgi:hypothetical protein